MHKAKTSNIKIVLIGAGSLFFGRQFIKNIIKSEVFHGGTLCLVDIDGKVLEKMTRLAKMAVREAGISLKIESSMDRRAVLEGADFVVACFAKDSIYYRGMECNVSAKYGVRMSSGDSAGPGGIFRALRELPTLLSCADDTLELCPDAWFINLTNPLAVNGLALRMFKPELKSISLSNGPQMPNIKKHYLKNAQIIESEADYTPEHDEKFEMKIVGVNKFSWILEAKYDGRDIIEDIAESVKLKAVEELDALEEDINTSSVNVIAYDIYRAFGYLPLYAETSKEYMVYWQGKNVSKELIPEIKLWNIGNRYDRLNEMWKEIDGYLEGKKPIDEFLNDEKPLSAVKIIESLITGKKSRFYINTFSSGVVDNMTPDTYLEILCEVGKDSIKPLHLGEIPRSIKGLIEIIADMHEITAEAVYNEDINLLRRAMILDPLICSMSDADAILNELLEIEKHEISSSFFQ